MPEIPAAPPALSADGVIYIGDQGGGLSAVSPAGELLWHFQPEDAGETVHSPIVDFDGNIYCLLDDYRAHLFSLPPEEKRRWSIRTGTKAADTGPRRGPNGDMIFVRNLMLNSQDGSQIEVETPADRDPVFANRAQDLVGADGERYLQIGHTLVQWQPLGKSGFEIIQSAEWDYRSAGFGQNSNFPQDSGVMADQIVWLFYSWRYGGTKMVWVDVSGSLLGICLTDLRQRSKPIAIDNTNTAFICGLENTSETDPPAIIKCLALAAGSDDPKWELILNEQKEDDITGAGMASGKLYVVIDAGVIYALAQSDEET